MKHMILAKLKNPADREGFVEGIRTLFGETLEIPGISAVRVLPCCTDRSNRYDLMIEITMEKEALEAYDSCEAHRRWKEEYGPALVSKAIFDWEE